MYTKVSDKMAYANSADSDKIAPEGSTLFAVPQNTSRNNCIKNKIYAKKVCNKVFEILGHLSYKRTV